MGLQVHLELVDPVEYDLSEVEKFLSGLSMDPTLKNFKGFEEDLRGDLNPTAILENLFWKERRWLDLPVFAQYYWEKYKLQLQKSFPDSFARLGKDVYQHLRARLYRTQLGFLTEYHAVILIASVFSKEKGYSVWRSSDLDRLGVDCQIRYEKEGIAYNIHIFVDSWRSRKYRDKKRKEKHSDKVDGYHIDFPYTLKKDCIHSLRYLPNGFGVYTKDYVEHLFLQINKVELQKKKQLGVDCKKGLVFGV